MAKSTKEQVRDQIDIVRLLIAELTSLAPGDSLAHAKERLATEADELASMRLVRRDADLESRATRAVSDALKALQSAREPRPLAVDKANLTECVVQCEQIGA